MKKYTVLIKKKNKLEEKIAKLCDKFTKSTGLVVANAEMELDFKMALTTELKNEIYSNYKVEVNCRL